MFANLSQSNPRNLNTTSNGYNAVIDFLSQFKVGSSLTEDDFSGLNQNVSCIRSSLNRLIQDGFLEKLELNICDACNNPVDEDLICQECGKNVDVSSSSTKVSTFRVLKNVDCSTDYLWAIDKAFFNTKIYGVYAGGMEQEYWACIRLGEILLPVSAKIKNNLPTTFKHSDGSYQVNSDETFFPLFGNRVRHYHYSVIQKENIVVQNNHVTNYGNIGSLNQSNQSSNEQANSMAEVVSLLDLILKNMDSSAATYAQHKEQLQSAKTDPDLFSKLNTISGFLSSIVTIAGFDLTGTVAKIQKLLFS